jgi:hypothetical protein
MSIPPGADAWGRRARHVSVCHRGGATAVNISESRRPPTSLGTRNDCSIFFLAARAEFKIVILVPNSRLTAPYRESIEISFIASGLRPTILQFELALLRRCQPASLRILERMVRKSDFLGTRASGFRNARSMFRNPLLQVRFPTTGEAVWIGGRS